MHVVEGPFVTRQALVSVLRLGEPSTEAPFRTLRRHSAVSAGASVPLRSSSGQLLGRVHLYSTLSADAARLSRLGRPKAAVRLARKAAALERSPYGHRVLQAIERSASRVPVDGVTKAHTDAQTQAFCAYVDMRRTSSWQALEGKALWRAWVIDPESWLEAEPDASVRDAVDELASRAARARKADPDLSELGMTTFVGVVQRIDPVAAELRGPSGERFIVPRRDLEREGLAAVGKAVTVLREELPGGRVLDSYAAAALLDAERPAGQLDPYGGPMTVPLDAADSAWLERVLATEPTIVPLAPLLVGER